MTDDLVKRLREWPGKRGTGPLSCTMDEAADRIEHLESINLSQSLITVDHLSRIEQLEAALFDIIGILEDPTGGQHVFDMRFASGIARVVLAGEKP